MKATQLIKALKKGMIEIDFHSDESTITDFRPEIDEDGHFFQDYKIEGTLQDADGVEMKIEFVFLYSGSKYSGSIVDDYTDENDTFNEVRFDIELIEFEDAFEFTHKSMILNSSELEEIETELEKAIVKQSKKLLV